MRHWTLFTVLLAIFSASGLFGCCSCFWDGFHRASQNRRHDAAMSSIPPVRTGLNIETEFYSANPSAGDSAVSIDAKIYVFFKDRKEMMTGNESTIFVLRDQYGQMVKGEISYGQGVTAFFPAANFQPGWNYRVTVSELSYKNGNRINGSKSWVFSAKK